MTARGRGYGHAPVLVLESSTYQGTVALIQEHDVLASEQVAMRGVHEERLMPAIARALSRAAVSIGDLDRVVCGAGPGSFTSLRIAAAIAKGLVTPSTRTGEQASTRVDQASGKSANEKRGGRGPTLASVSSLLLIVAGALERLTPGAYIAVLDAMRGERYGMLLSVVRDDDAARGGGRALSRIEGTRTWRRLSVEALERWGDEAGARLIGPGYALDAWPSAAGARWVPESVEDVDPVSWEPEYGRLAEAEVRRAAAGESAGAQRPT